MVMREIHRGETLVVRAGYDDRGRLTIDGQDLGGHPLFEEYEYFLRVAPEHFGLLRSALGGGADAELVDLLATRGDELVRRGETRWLKEHGIPFDLDTSSR